VSPAEQGHSTGQAFWQPCEGVPEEVEERLAIHEGERGKRNRGLGDFCGLLRQYFSVYALLSNLGVKSEIHDCTIALFAYLFRGSVSPGLVEGLRRSKRHRIETQYYTGEVGLDLGEMSVETNRFVLEMEKVLDGLNTRRIAELREKLKRDIGS